MELKESMNNSKVDVVGIGNAIVDVLLQVDDLFLEEHNRVNGSMNLIDAQDYSALYKKISSLELILLSGSKDLSTSSFKIMKLNKF